MNRRTLLGTAAAVASAGCQSIARPPTNEPDGEVSGSPSVTVASASIEPDRGLAFDASVVRPFGDDAPATLAVELANAGDETRAFQTGPSPPLNPSIGHRVGGNDRLFVVPPDGTGYEVPHEVPDEWRDDPNLEVNPPEPDERLVPQEPTDGCWRGQYERLRVYHMARGATLDPGESIARRYVLVADPENDSCLPSGTYEITDDARIDGDDAAIELVLELSHAGT